MDGGGGVGGGWQNRVWSRNKDWRFVKQKESLAKLSLLLLFFCETEGGGGVAGFLRSEVGSALNKQPNQVQNYF